MADHRREELQRARDLRPVADEQRVQQAHRVAGVAVADGLDVGVLVRVDRARDRDALRVVDAVVGRRHGEDRLAVGAHELAEAVRDVRQRTVVAAALQQLVRPERAGGQDDVLGGDRAAVLAQQRAGALGRHRVAVGAVARAERADVDDLALGDDLTARVLGEPEIVLGQGVLRADRAADHAAPAGDAARALGALAVEEGVGDRLAGRAEEDADARLGVRLVGLDVPAEVAQQVVGGIVGGDRRDAEHPLGLVVVRRERGLPVVLQAGPLVIGIEPRAGAVQRVRVAEAAAAHAGAGEDRDVLEERQAEDAVQAQAGGEEVAPQVPGRARELVVGVASAGLHHRDAVALLRQAMGGDAAPESGADHEPVVVVSITGRRSHGRGRVART